MATQGGEIKGGGKKIFGYLEKGVVLRGIFRNIQLMVIHDNTLGEKVTGSKRRMEKGRDYFVGGKKESLRRKVHRGGPGRIFSLRCSFVCTQKERGGGEGEWGGGGGGEGGERAILAGQTYEKGRGKGVASGINPENTKLKGIKNHFLRDTRSLRGHSQLRKKEVGLRGTNG